MGIDYEHPQYAKTIRRKTWKKCRDAIEGEDAIMDDENAEEYLPKLTEEDDIDYRRRKNRSSFYDAPSRVKSACSGYLFRKPMQIGPENMPKALADWLGNVDQAGTSIEEYIKDEVTDEVLEVGRVGVLVEMPEDPRPQPHPYLVAYSAEDIFFWEYRLINGSKQPYDVRLKINYTVESGDDGYNREKRQRILRLFLKKAGESFVYVQQEFDKTENGWEFKQEIAPMVSGRTLDYIPFIIINAQDLKPDIKTPPLRPLVGQALDHYETMADYKLGLHFTSIPQPVICGRVDPTSKFKLGCQEAWVIPDHDAKVQYLEWAHEPKHLPALEKNEQYMAVLGARFIEPHRKGVETAETTRMRQGSESSTLSDISDTISEGMTQILKIVAEWLNVPSDAISVRLNKDFIDQKLSHDEVKAAIDAYERGILPAIALFEILSKGEWLPHDMKFDEWAENLPEPMMLSSPPLVIDAEPVNADT